MNNSAEIKIRPITVVRIAVWSIVCLGFTVDWLNPQNRLYSLALSSVPVGCLVVYFLRSSHSGVKTKGKSWVLYTGLLLLFVLAWGIKQNNSDTFISTMWLLIGLLAIVAAFLIRRGGALDPDRS